MMALSPILPVLFLSLTLMLAAGLCLAVMIKVLRDHERAIVIRLGRVLNEIKGPGILMVLPGLDRMVRVDLSTLDATVPASSIVAHLKITPSEAERIMSELRRAKEKLGTGARSSGV